MSRLALLVLVSLIACSSEDACPTIDPSTGAPVLDPRFCDLGFMPTPSETAISPSASCSGGACLRVPLEHEVPMCGEYPQGSKGLCTGQCQVDADCDGLEGPCITGYACGIATAVGAYCCLPFCVCKDFIEIPTDGLSTPAPCEAANPDNACCNLDGRTGSTMYPRCE